MPRVLVPGGTGYIGSHTLVELIGDGFDAHSIDSCVRSHAAAMDGVRAITGRDVCNHDVDLRDAEATNEVFAAVGPIDAVIHFAAFKSVPESVREPLLYFAARLLDHPGFDLPDVSLRHAGLLAEDLLGPLVQPPIAAHTLAERIRPHSTRPCAGRFRL